MRMHVVLLIALASYFSAGCSIRSGSLSSLSTSVNLSQQFDSTTGSYKLSYSVPLGTDAAQIDSIELREFDMNVYAKTDLNSCSAGIPVKTWIAPFSSGQSISGFYLSGSQGRFRYLICTRKTDGTVSASADAGAVAAGVSMSAASVSYTAVKVASGQYFTCALLSNGRIKCWGNNQYGQLGQGDVTARGDGPGEMGSNLAYIDLGSSDGSPLLAIDVQAGLNHACALMSDGRVKCWGRNHQGQLGLGDTATRGDAPGEMGDNLAFVDLGKNMTARQIELGGDFSCAILKTNKVKCWGANGSGQLGRENTTAVGNLPNQMGDNLATINLGGDGSVKALAAGLEHICALLSSNNLKCWGLNDIGQLGVGDNINRGDAANTMGDNLKVVDVVDFLLGPASSTAISAGTSHTCVLSQLGQMKCWGDNFAGQLGIGSAIAEVGDRANQMGLNLQSVDFGPIFMSYQQPVVKMQVGFYTTCAQLWTSEIKCWGANHYAQLGNGTAKTSWGTSAAEMGASLPSVNIGSSTYVKMFSSQYGTTCVITQDSLIKCWGINTNGALGYGDTTNRGSSASQMGASLPYVDL